MSDYAWRAVHTHVFFEQKMWNLPILEHSVSKIFLGMWHHFLAYPSSPHVTLCQVFSLTPPSLGECILFAWPLKNFGSRRYQKIWHVNAFDHCFSISSFYISSLELVGQHLKISSKILGLFFIRTRKCRPRLGCS